MISSKMGGLAVRGSPLCMSLGFRICPDLQPHIEVYLKFFVYCDDAASIRLILYTWHMVRVTLPEERVQFSPTHALN